jgi:hypothetical protein
MSSISVVVLSVQRDRGSVARARFAHAPTAKISARPPLPASPPPAERGPPVRPRRHGLQLGNQIPSISRRSTGLRNGSARRPAIGSAADRYRQMYENHFERQGRQIETGGRDMRCCDYHITITMHGADGRASVLRLRRNT